MSLIRDVREEIKKLDFSKKNLRRFGLIVGLVFLLLTLWAAIKKYPITLLSISGIAGGLLIVAGVFIPHALRGIYKFWMGIAFCIGWIVSRILLTIIFYLIITPIGFTAYLLGKKFMDAKIKSEQDTYWVRKNKEKKVNYEKMY